MATLRSIATRFVITGVTHLARETTRIGRLFASAASTAGTAIASFSRASVRHIGTVTRALAGISFRGLTLGGKLAFGGLAAAAVGAATKIGLISVAAKKMTDEISEYLRRLDTLAKTTGESVGDIAALSYTADLNGGDADELLPTLGTIADSFGEIRRSIEDADAAYAKTKDWTAKGLIAAITTGDSNAASGIISAAVAAREGSMTGIQDRQAGIYSDIQKTARGGKDWRRAIDAGISERDVSNFMSRRRLALVAEYKSLEEAKKRVEDGMGPAGEALRRLEEVGLDMDKALKGGVDTLYALADALDRIPDSNEKLGIAQQLFGEDAGAKNLALLQGGRAAIEKNRREMERYGALPTEEDAARGAALKKSETRRGMAFQGLELEVHRGLSPLMEETNNELAEWLARNRTTIAGMIQETFVAVRTVFYDVLKFIEGNTDYESAIFKKGAAILKWSRKVIVAISEIASAAMTEVGNILSGADSNWAWLNNVRDAFLWIKALAIDAFAVITGSGQAVNFEWLNTARAMFDDFMKHLREAWDMFRKVLDGIHTAVKPVLSFFNTDILTATLFVGMLKFTGILSGLAILGRGLLGIFRPALSGIGSLAALMAGKVGLIGTAFVAAYAASQMVAGYLADKFVERETAVQDKIAELMKVRDQAYIEDKYSKIKDPEQRRRFQKGLGFNYYSGKLASEQRDEDIALFNSGQVRVIGRDYDKPMTDEEKARAGAMHRALQERQGAGKIFNVNLSLGGKTTSMFGAGDPAVVAELERLERAGGNY